MNNLSGKQCLICNCEKSMPLDEKQLSKAMGVNVDKIHMSLCRAQLESFEAALKSGDELIVACTQEAPLFQEVAEEQSPSTHLRFVNIRENAGWAKDAGKAHPKIAALLKDAEYDPTPARLKSIYSNGMCLVYGSGQQAYETAKLLGQRLSVTLLLSDDDDFVLSPIADVPVYKGKIAQASGSFGAFEVTVDNYAPLRPASRETLEFAIARNGAKSNCSLILDLSGNSPLFPGYAHRDGYAYVDPGDPASVIREAIKFLDMVGEFEKPIYIDYNSETCAHSRSQKPGCNKCLDVCPAGAITDAGDLIEIDSGICGGCGSCHSVCPTGSISYQYPSRSDIIIRAQNVVSAYSDAGGKNPVLLIHDEPFGVEMISALARFSDGLPANVIPLGFHAVTSLGHVELLGMVASGAAQVLLLTDPKWEEELSGLDMETTLANDILAGLELTKAAKFEIICEVDPEVFGQTLWNLEKHSSLKNDRFEPVGSKREMGRVIFSRLHEASKAKPDSILLTKDAPYGLVDINQEACTLCMACTSACPANAITDTVDEPKLRFTQSACVQCGLCVNTCPEKALSLVPQLDFTPAALQPQTLYEEEPFECISCGTPFAAKSTIERIAGQLAGKHSMFANEERARLIKMCENCRIEVQANSSDDPFVTGSRPKPRTTEDYLAAEDGTLNSGDFLIDD